MRSKRADIAEGIADSLLAAGVAQIPLRDLAARLNTSDRMLLYYFTDKADLIRCSLDIVSARLSAMLADALPAGLAPAVLAEKAFAILRSEAVTPYMAVWSDLAARAARGEEPFESIGRGMAAGWLAWVESRLDPQAPDRKRTASAILVMLEGARLLDRIAPGAAQGAVDLLCAGFDRKDRSAALSDAL